MKPSFVHRHRYDDMRKEEVNQITRLKPSDIQKLSMKVAPFEQRRDKPAPSSRP
jgi:hypothetical protein